MKNITHSNALILCIGLIAIAICVGAPFAWSADVEVTWSARNDIPIAGYGWNAADQSIQMTLDFSPEPGTELTVIRNRGTDFIYGEFAGLSHGQKISLTNNGTAYDFVADYYGGPYGRDLVLTWADNRLFAWGYGNLGVAKSQNAPTPVDTWPYTAIDDRTMLRVAVGVNHSLALRADGTLVAWGLNDHGQLGDGTLTTRPWAVDVATDWDSGSALYGKTVVDIEAGEYHSLALCSDGTVVAWGRNVSGQLGVGQFGEVITVPTAVNGPFHGGVLMGRKVIGIAAGLYHSLAICSDGTLAAWGKNDSGQLGDGTETDRGIPVAISTDPLESTLAYRQVLAFAAGSGHSVALCSDGTLHAWGNNSFGQLGQADPVFTSVSSHTSYSGGPQGFWDNSTLQGISSGLDTYNGVLNNSAVQTLSGGFGVDLPFAFNPIAVGRWFDETANPVTATTIITTSVTSPNWRKYPGFVLMPDPFFWVEPVAVRAGVGFTLVLFADGSIASWGDNSEGQLGSGSRNQRRWPGAVSTNSGLSALNGKVPIAIGCGGDFSTAVLSDGNMVAWGNNTGGELGDDTAVDRQYPTLVSKALFDPGERFAAISHSPDSSMSIAIVGIPKHPRMEVEGNSRAIYNGKTWPWDGDSTFYGVGGLEPIIHTFTIENSGEGDLDLTGTPRVVLSGDGAAYFTVSEQPPASIGSDGSATFDISFMPVAPNEHFATVTIENDDPGENPYTFTISGYGTDPHIKLSGSGAFIANNSTNPKTANSTAFGTSLPGNPVTNTFTIENVGGGYLNLTGLPIVAVSGAHASDFTVVTMPTSNVFAGESTTLSIAFDGSFPGARDATVSIPNDCDSKNPFTFAVRGTGPAPDIEVFGNSVSITNGANTGRLEDHTDFGHSSTGTTIARTFTIRNDGVGDLQLTNTPSIVLGGAHSNDFAITLSPSNRIAAGGGTSAFEVTFSPSVVGKRSTGIVVIASDDYNQDPYVFMIEAQAAAPTMAVSGNGQPIPNGDNEPTQTDLTDFGTAPVGVPVTNVFEIRNEGSGDLYLAGPTKVVLSGSDAGDFAIQQDASSPILPGGTTTFAVVFTSPMAGKRSDATVTIDNDDPLRNPYSFAVSGFGPVPIMSVSGDGVTITNGDAVAGLTDLTDFGALSAGLSVTNSYTIHNSGLVDLSLTGTPRVALSGSDAGDFAVVQYPDTTVSAAGTTTFAIAYTPSVVGKTSDATVSLENDDAERNPFTFSIQGHAPVPEIRVMADDVTITNGDLTAGIDDDTDFGSSLLGVPVTNEFTIINEGLGNLNLTGTPRVAIGGTDPGDFAVVQLPATPVAGGSNTTTFAVTYTPTVIGKLSVATVSIESDDADMTPYTFAVQGKGPKPSMTILGHGTMITNGAAPPTTANHTDLGTSPLGVPVTNIFTVSSTGLLPLNLTGTPVVAISGADAGDFSVAQMPATSVSANTGVTTFAIAFTPSVVGKRSLATITLANDDREEDPYSFAIQGFGPVPVMTVLGDGTTITNGDLEADGADETDFGSTSSGFPVTNTFTIINDGLVELHLTGTPVVAISGTDPGDFAITRAPSNTVDFSGGTSLFDVVYAPSVPGKTSTATIVIANDDGERNPYAFGVEGFAPVPLINVLGSGVTITNGATMVSLTDSTDFGASSVGFPVTNTFTIRNDGFGHLWLTGGPKVEIGGSHPGDFSVTLQPASPVDPSGGTSVFEVVFLPTTVGRTSEVVVSISNDDSTRNPFTFALQGYAPFPVIEVSGNEQPIANGDSTPTGNDFTDFGSTAFGTSVTGVFKIANRGQGNLRLTGTPLVAISGVAASDFTVNIDPVSPVLPTGTTAFEVVFSPTVHGFRGATCTIESDDPVNGTYAFDVVGSGPGPEYDLYESQPAIAIDLKDIFNDPAGTNIYSVTGRDFPNSLRWHLEGPSLTVLYTDWTDSGPTNTLYLRSIAGVQTNDLPFKFNFFQINSPPVLKLPAASDDGFNQMLTDKTRLWADVASSSNGSRIIAAAYKNNDGYLYTSADGGSTWVARATDVPRNWQAVASSADGSRMVAAVSDNSSEGYVYTSADGGSTWVARITDQSRTWGDVDCSADGMKLVAVQDASLYGTNAYLYTSSDGGVTWTQRLSDRSFGCVASSDDGTKIVAGSGGNYTEAGPLWVSHDSGTTWTSRFTNALYHWADVDCSADGSKFVAAAAYSHIYISDDAGDTWTRTSEGNRGWDCVVSSRDGMTMAASGVLYGYDYVRMSHDGGETWDARFKRNNLSGQYFRKMTFIDDEKRILGADRLFEQYLLSFTAEEPLPVVRAIVSRSTNTPYFAQVDLGYNDTNGQVNFYLENDNPSLFSEQPVLYTNGNFAGLRFTPEYGVQGFANVSVTAWDDQGTANGGNDTALPQDFIIEVVASVNTAPAVYLASSTVTVWQGSGSYTGGTGFASFSPGSAYDSWQTLKWYILSNDKPGLFSSQPAIDNAGTLTFTPWPSASGEASVTVVVQDDGGTTDGGVDKSTNSFTIVVGPANSAPEVSFASLSVTVRKNAPQQTILDFATFWPGAEQDAWQQLTGYTLAADDSSLFSTQPVIDSNGTLTFTPATDAVGTSRVEVVVQDDGGTLGEGVDVSTNAFLIKLIDSLDPYTVTTTADSGPGSLRQVILNANTAGVPVKILFVNNLGYIDPVPPLPVLTNTVSFSAGAGNDLNGTVVLVGNGGSVDLGLSTLPGGAVQLQDGGRFADDGEVDEKLIIADGGIINPGLASGAKPGLLVAEEIYFEGGGTYEWGIKDADGDAGQVSDLLAARTALILSSSATASNPFTIKIKSFTADDAPGALPAFDKNQAYKWPIFFCVPTGAGEPEPDDRGIHGFEELNGIALDLTEFTNFNDTAGGRFSILPVGDVLQLMYSPNLTPIATADQYLLQKGGSLNVNSTNGVMSNDYDPYLDPISALEVGGVTNGGSLTLNADGSFTYDPASPLFTGVDSFEYAVTDGSRTSSPAMVTIYVLPTNAPPSFLLSNNFNVAENSGPQVYSNFAYNISAGTALEDESGQSVSFILTNDNSGLFAAEPALDDDGDLTFTTASNAYGAALVTVVAQDDGGTNNGGMDVSGPQLFTLTVDPVNTRPLVTFSADPLIVQRTASAVTSNNFATFDSGATNESAQSLIGYVVTNDAPELFSVQPGINNAGTLTFTPLNANTTGQARVTVVAQDDGGVANGGTDTVTNQFVLAIVGPNSAPSFGFTENVLLPGTVWFERNTNRMWSSLASSSNGLTLAATVSNGFIYVSTDGGVTWDERCTSNVWMSVACSADGTKLVAAAFGDKIYTSTNSGTTWVARDTNQPWQVVACSADGTRQFAGAHAVNMFSSTNSGETWSPPGSFPASNFRDLDCSADGGHLVLTRSGSGYIQMSDNAGVNWRYSGNLPSFGSGDWAGCASSSNGLILAAAKKGGSLYTSTDRGTNYYGTESSRNWAGIDMSDDGQKLAAVVSGGKIYLSDDGGAAWEETSSDIDDPNMNRPWSAVSVSGDGERIAAATAGGKIYTTGDRVMRIPENAGYVAIPRLVSDISAGPALDALQTVNFAVTNNNPSLFSVQPSVDGEGNMVLTLASNTTGQAVLTITAQDDGGTANGGVDTAVRTLTMIVVPGPRVEEVTSPVTNGTYRAIGTIPVHVTFSKPVTVLGTPLLYLNSGGTGVYVTGSGGSNLVFEYEIAGSDDSLDLDYTDTMAMAFNGGAIRATNSIRNANSVLPPSGSTNSLGGNKDIVIEALPLTAFDQSLSIREDRPEAITLTGFDPLGLPLTFSLIATPTNGNLSGTEPNVTYTPDLNFVGNDSFTFVVDNGGSTSSTAMVSLTVSNSNNDTPTDISLSSNVVQELQPAGTAVGTLTTVDPDAGDSFIYSFVAGAGSEHNAHFQIVNAELLTAVELDAAVTNRYRIRVRATDQGGLFCEEPFTIDVTEIPITMTLPADSILGTNVTLNGQAKALGDSMTVFFEYATNTSVQATVSTHAGVNGDGYSDGPAASAEFYEPYGVAVDSSGTVYVADTENSCIRKISTGGIVSTLAGTDSSGYVDATGTSARFRYPYDIAVDGNDMIYVADTYNNCIRKITPAGVVTTLAGTNSSGFQEGTGYAARFDSPRGVAADDSGNVYVADYDNSRIRKITPAGVVSTLAGNGNNGFQDGAGETAEFYRPRGVAVDGDGNVYVRDAYNYRVRKISAGGIVSTLAGDGSSGYLDGIGTQARFSASGRLAVDHEGNVIVADAGNDCIRRITPSGVVSTLAGVDWSGYQDGPGSTAEFDYPSDVAVDAAGQIYVADTYNNLIRAISVQPPPRIVAQHGITSSTNVPVSAVATQLLPNTIYYFRAVGTNSQGTLYGQYLSVTTAPWVTTLPAENLSSTSATLRVDVDGWGYNCDVYFEYGIGTNFEAMVETLAGTGDFGSNDGPGSQAEFAAPGGVAIDASGNVYVGDYYNHKIRKITAEGTVSTYAGSGSSGHQDGPALTALFNRPYGVAVDSATNVYVADKNNERIRKISPDGIVTTLAGNGSSGLVDGPGATAEFNEPWALTVDSNGIVYVCDSYNHVIRKITPDGVVTTFAGTGSSGHQDGAASTSQFYRPWGAVVHSSGDIYIGDRSNDRIRRITPESIVSTVAGQADWGFQDGPAFSAKFNSPRGVAFDSEDNLYIADRFNHRIRRLKDGTVSTVAGNGDDDSVDGPANEASFNSPTGVAVDHDGNLIVCEYDGHKIRKIVMGTTRLTAPGQNGIAGSNGIAVATMVTGLTENTTYYFRAVCSNSLGITYSEFVSVTTPSGSATDPTLTVVSAYGGESPGTTMTNAGTALSLFITNSPVTLGTTQYVANGAAVTGNEAIQVSGTNVTLTLTNDATLTWLWTTNFWLSVSNEVNGSVNVASGWQPAGVVTTLTATGDSFYHFTNWTGDVTGPEVHTNPLTLTLDESRAVTAVFSANLTSNTWTPEWWLDSFYPGTSDFENAAMTDTDGDGVRAWAEAVAGTIPTNADSVLVLDLAGEMSGGTNGFVVTWPSATGRYYRIYWSTNLPAGAELLPGATNIAATPPMNSWTNASNPDSTLGLFWIGVRTESF